MADLTAIRQGLAANLAALTGVQVSPYMLANPTPPAVTLYPADVTYDLAMRRGLDRWAFTVQAFVGLTTDIGAQATLDQFIASSGTQSVKKVLEKPDGPNGEATLGGVVNEVNVVSCTGYRLYLREGAPTVLGAEWRVEILATGL